MDRINFLAQDSFPVSTNTLERLQQEISRVANMSFLGGSNYILSGCVDSGTNVTPGIIVIEGELLPFIGGIKQEKIAIQETQQTLTAFGISYPEAYINRVAVFSSTGQYNWSDFKQVLTTQELQQRIDNIKGDKPGTVKMWAGQIEKISQEYRLCDGALLSVIDYPELFENLGTAFGGNGVSSFALPDLRAKFIVGFDSSKTDYNALGKYGGNETVTLTKDQIPAHDHVRNALFNKLSARAGDVNEQATPGSIDQATAQAEYNVGSMTEQRWNDATIQSVGGGQSHENRPPYFTLAYIIKVK
jgi:microcystin-dependent protein